MKLDPDGINKDSMGMTAMLEASKISHSYERIIRDEEPTIANYREVIRNIFIEDDKAKSWLEYLDVLELEELEPAEESGFIRKFRFTATMQYREFAKQSLPLSNIGARAFSVSRIREARMWIVDDIFTVGMEPGGTGYIYGVPGSGKSNFAVGEIYRIMSKRKCQIDTNIPIKNPSKNYKWSTLLSSTFRNAAEYMLEWINDESEGDALMVWINDETQYSRDRQRSASDRNIWMKQANLVSRKLGLFQWSILQQNKPPSEVLEFATHKIQKPDRQHKDFIEYLNIGKYYIKKSISGLPSAEERGLEYSSKSIVTYTPDINPLRMGDWLTGILKDGYLDDVRQYEEIIKYIDIHCGEMLDIISDDVVAMLLYRMRKRCIDKQPREVSYRRLGILVGWSEKKTERAIKAVKKSIDEGLVIPDDTDDLVKDMAGAVGVSDDNAEDVPIPDDENPILSD